MKFSRTKHSNNAEPTGEISTSFDTEMLKLVAGGLEDVLPDCKNHEWVLSGSRTDVTTNVTLNYYKCLKCNAEKTERA